MDSNNVSWDYIPKLQGWSKQDKYNLLQALKSSKDLEGIRQGIPNKSEDEIKKAIYHYKKLAVRHPIITEKRRREKKNVVKIPRIPLACWAKLLTDSARFENLHTETANAMRMIAEFGNIPSAKCTNNADFKKIYYILANAMDGKLLDGDRMTTVILDKCLIETALLSKSFLRPITLKKFLSEVIIREREFNTILKPLGSNELAMAMHMASQKRYNPLTVPIEYLKSNLMIHFN